MQNVRQSKAKYEVQKRTLEVLPVLARQAEGESTMPSCRNSGEPGTWCQGWRRRSHPQGLALTLGVRRLARPGHEAQTRAT
jgi:hypothetical protein